jgi:asparagine N-glycosylation enzyme membrane subunit Stt3
VIWAWIGKATIWMLAFVLILFLLTGLEVWVGDDGLHGAYRAIVRAAIGAALAYLIFRCDVIAAEQAAKGDG